MGNYSSVFKFHHGMNHALRLDHNLNLLHRDAEQPSCFHHFQPLVHHRGAVDCYLSAHRPVGMLKRILHLNVLHLLPRSFAERAARCSQKDFMYPVSMLAVQALEYGAMFTVHRQYPDILLFCQRHDDMACGHKRFLIREGNVLARLHCRNGRPDANHTYNCRHQNLRGRFCGNFEKAFHPAYHLHIEISHPAFKFSRLLLIPDCGELRCKFPDLTFQKRYIASGG